MIRKKKDRDDKSHRIEKRKGWIKENKMDEIQKIYQGIPAHNLKTIPKK